MNKKTKETKWQTLGKTAVAVIGKYWWKTILIILTIGIAITGFTCECGDTKVHKDPVIQKALENKADEKEEIYK